MRYIEVSDEVKDATIIKLIELVISLSKSTESAMQLLSGKYGISCEMLDKYYPGWVDYMPEEDEGGDQ